MDQVLKDRNGNLIGKIRSEGNKDVIYDRNNNRLGYFDGKDTFDRNCRKIGSGNLLTTLL